MKKNAVKKPVKIIITPQAKTAENYTKEYYDLLLKHDILLLLADMLEKLEMRNESINSFKQ